MKSLEMTLRSHNPFHSEAKDALTSISLTLRITVGMLLLLLLMLHGTDCDIQVVLEPLDAWYPVEPIGKPPVFLAPACNTSANNEPPTPLPTV